MVGDLPTSAGQPPGPARNLITDRKGKFLRTPLREYLIDSFTRYGELVGFRFLNVPLYLVAHPEHIDHVLRTNNRNYVKAGINYRVLKRLFGEGLLTSAGSHWREQRRLLQPVFQPHRITGFGSVVTDTTLEMLRRWRGMTEPDHAVDLLAELTWLTLKILGLAFF
jgi:cytochrome P450